MIETHPPHARRLAAGSSLDQLPPNLPPLARDRAVAVHCKSGYRSTIA